MESKFIVDRSSAVEMTSDIDNSSQQVAHLDTYRSAPMLSAVGQGTVVSVDTSAGSAIRP